jgi:hypothetical protein
MINQSGAIFGPTVGIARNLSVEPVAPADAPGAIQGGGNLNGTQATSILVYQAGTNATRWQMPRKFPNSGNWCGIV